jgi:hypothetical protein
MLGAVSFRPQEVERVKPLSRLTLIVAAFIAAILLLGVSASAVAGARPARPGMKLRVSTHHGYLPLTVTVEGKLADTEPAAIDACLLSVEWTYTPPGGQTLNSKEESPCVEPPSQIRVPESFKKDVTLKEAGTYSYRIILVGKEGKRFASTSQEVRVIKGPVEVGTTVTRTDGRR